MNDGLIDEERIRSYLNDFEKRLLALSAETTMDSTHERIRGGVQTIKTIRDQLPLLRYTPHTPKEKTPMDEISAPAKNLVRHRNRGGSMEAALSQLPEKRQRMYRIIYGFLKVNGPQTDHELRAAMRRQGVEHSYSGVSARRVELERAGWVADTGEKRETENGKKATVWRAVESD